MDLVSVADVAFISIPHFLWIPDMVSILDLVSVPDIASVPECDSGSGVASVAFSLCIRNGFCFGPKQRRESK